MAALLVLYLSPLEKTKIIIIIIIVINNILAVTFSKIQLDINGHKQLKSKSKEYFSSNGLKRYRMVYWTS